MEYNEEVEKRNKKKRNAKEIYSKYKESHLKAQKKYYEKNKEYYRKQSIKEAKRVRKERNLYKEIIKEAREYCRNDDNFQIIVVEPYAQSMVKGIQRKLLEILDKAGDSNE